MKHPEYVEVAGKKYKINTDFRVAIECNRIAEDKTIGDFERAMGIICTLFGEEAVDDTKHLQEFLDLALKYLSCGKPLEDLNEEERDMDYIEDYDYIVTSFMSDYGMDLENETMHWWKFNNLINGLSNSELGNCCVLNRVRNLRNYDVSEIKDKKQRDKIIEAKEKVALKKYKKENNITAEQEKSMQELNKILGL